MGLACCECDKIMEPSLSLPGREGTMVRPVLLAVAWKTDRQLPDRRVFTFTPIADRLALCFACIDGKTPQERRPLLQTVYDCFDAEVIKRRTNLQNHIYGLNDVTDRLIDQADKVFKEKEAALPKNECLFCGETDLTRDWKPTFVVKVLDKAKMEMDQVPYFGGYQWSKIQEGLTRFLLCFNCFDSRFPNTSNAFSSSLTGIPLPPTAQQARNEFYIDPQVWERLSQEQREELTLGAVQKEVYKRPNNLQN